MQIKEYLGSIKYELISYAALAVVTLVVGHANLIGALHEISGHGFITENISESVKNVLQSFDNFSFAPDSVDLLFWFIISLVVLSLIKAAHKTIITVREEAEISSDFYIHPQNFTKTGFWSELLITSFWQLLSVFVVVLLWIVAATILLPLGMTISRIYLVEAGNWLNIYYLIIGYILVFLAISLSALSLKLLFTHPRLSPYNN